MAVRAPEPAPSPASAVAVTVAPASPAAPAAPPAQAAATASYAAGAPASASFDVAIVGAGTAGASLGWALATAPHAPRVVVLEREEQPGYHTTGRSAALYMASYGTPAIRALTRASRTFLDAPPAGFVTTPLLAPRGVLLVAAPEQRDAVETAWRELSARGAPVRRVGVDEMLHRAPCLRPERSAWGISEDGASDIDVHALHDGYLRGMRRCGGVLRTGAGLRSVARTAGAWQLALADGSVVQATTLVDAAGAWADEVAAMAGAAGVRPIGLEPRRRTAFTFAPPPGSDVHAWPAIVAIDESWYVKPDAGRLLGSPANADPVAPHDVVAEEYDVALGIHRIEAATTLAIRRPQRVWAGLRSFVADGDMVIGRDAAAPDFVWLAGQGGYGIQSAPGAAALAAALLLGHPLPDALRREGVDPAAFAPSRLR